MASPSRIIEDVGERIAASTARSTFWPMLEDLLRGNTQPVWFCGPSLGGAMATISAYRCIRSVISSNPEELHTFGSLRVGCKRYVRQNGLQHYRWVHNNDIVTNMPPPWMGYRHSGNEIYLDRHGRIRKLTGVLRSRDRWRGLVDGLLRQPSSTRTSPCSEAAPPARINS